MTAVPGIPVLSWPALGRLHGPRPACVLDAGPAQLVTSGRCAIALALQAMAVGPGQRVLLPAFHSPAMVPPVLWRGATPVFYRVRADASVDLDDIASRLDGATRVLVVTHYFGFPQALPAIRAFCDAHGLLLLEDCAHSLFGEVAGRPLGSYGDAAIASTMKFYPQYEGGCLVLRRPLAPSPLRSAGIGFELKAVLAPLERALACGRLAPLGWLVAPLLALKQRLWRRVQRRSTAARALAPAASDHSYAFEPYWVDKRSALFSRLLLRVLSARRLCALRRRNYATLLQALQGAPGWRPLHAELPPGVYPWVLPLVLDDAERVHQYLLAAGAPMVRFGLESWPGMAADLCPNSAALGRRVLSLPCHQTLRQDELAWLAATLRAALEAP